MKPGDLVVPALGWGIDEFWTMFKGFVPSGIEHGDLLVVLREEQHRVEVLTPEGRIGWISKAMLKEPDEAR